MHRLSRWASLALVTGACGLPSPSRLAPSGDLLTAAELAGTRAVSAYEAIRRLRPSLLMARGPSSVLVPGGAGPALWIDETYVGDVSALRDVPSGDVVSVHLVPAWDAATRYGSGFPNGVLVVETRP
jgi:hypothetical protein